MNNAALIANKLLKINAIKLSPSNPFTWASGLKSPIYCDNRITLSYPEIRTLIKKGLMDLSNDFDFDIIAGVATAGIPHGALLADALNVPFAYIRSKPKGHGRQNQVEGEIKEGSKVLLVEDLISTGKSSLEAVDVVRNVGATCVGVIAIFTYGLKTSIENFENHNCIFKCISNYNVLLQEAINSSYITSEEKTILQKWSQDPKNWQK